MSIKKFVLAGLINLLSVSTFAQAEQALKLWYTQPAGEWMKSLPLGNGRLGAMVFGGIQQETIALNEITMWSGQVDPDQEKRLGKEKLQEIRNMFFKGDIAEGNRVSQELMAGTPHAFGSHLPIGDLHLFFEYPGGKIENYYRDLDIEHAVAHVSYEKGGVRYSREYFCSNPDDVLVIKLSASRKSALNFSVGLDLLRQADVNPANNSLEFAGDMSTLPPGGVAFSGNITVKTDDGTVSAEDKQLKVKNATTVYIYIDIRTDYKSPDYAAICRNTVRKASEAGYETLKQKHLNDYGQLFSRVDLFLGNSDAETLPTDLRWLLVKEGSNDVSLDALFFQYARYLLIASSRENSPLPANLQGIWNDNLANNMGWTCDYHMDINTQQNYWLANNGNLAECNAPLFSYLEDLSVYGRKTAQNVYDARGWTTNTMVNVWGYTASGWGVNWGLFPMAGSWISSHLWTHYCYTQDKTFLQNQAYPLLKGNARFVLDYMTTDPKTGYLFTGPATSPENAFNYQGDVVSLSMMTTTDRVLAVELFNSVIRSSEILNTDKPLRDSLRKALTKLPPLQISKKYGGVQEWFEDYDEAFRNHRHTSHLLALYPFNQINPDNTPELARAAKQTLVRRLTAPDWEDVEWSRANMICFDARLKNPEDAYHSVVLLQRNFTRENLLTISPKGIAGAPYDIFIFDGNEAGAAGIAEMLLQSHNGFIEFLPALPRQWETGYFKGLCVQGACVVDLKWKEMQVTEAMLTASADNTVRIKTGNNKIPLFYKNGQSVKPKNTSGNIVSFSLSKGDRLNMVY